MSKKHIFFRIIFLILVSFALTYLTINKIGASLENFETKIYQKISGKKSQYLQTDSSGVPIVIYEGKLGRQYNSVTVAERALKLSDQKDCIADRAFLSCINWLINNSAPLNDSSIIYLDYFDWPGYKMTSPWRSAMNQGRAMQAFIKAFERTNDSVYLEYARKSMNVLYTEVEDGGVSYKDTSGYWYEEYADDSVPQSRVLNGMIVTLQGLSDYYKITIDTGALFLFSQGVKSVKNSLHLYDNNGHSNYDVLGKPANPGYHKFHIDLLEFLYAETHDPVFKEYQQKWSEYHEPAYLATLIKKPTRIGIFTIISLFVGYFVFISIIGFIIWAKKNGRAQPYHQNEIL